jgi:ferredoxin
LWPNIAETRNPPSDAEDFNGVANKFDTYFSPHPAIEPAT